MNNDLIAYENFKQILKESFKGVGPENFLEKPAYAIKGLDDNIKYDKNYFFQTYFLKEKVLDKIAKHANKINDSFGAAIFEELTKYIYQSFKDRGINIENTLNAYLQEEDVLKAFLKLKELLKNAYNRYTVTLVTDLISFESANSLSVGNVLLSNMDSCDSSEIIANKESRLLRVLLLHESKNIQSDNKINTALKVDIEGFHFENERSLVFNEALYEFRQVFSYLCMCKHFLANIKDRYVMETKIVDRDRSKNFIDEQVYFVKGSDNSKIFKKVYTILDKPILSKERFVLDDNLIKYLKNKCYIEKIKNIYSGNYGKLKNKIQRCFDWFLKAELEEDFTDKIIDLFISLESLLSNPMANYTNDMAENIARMLYQDVNERLGEKKKIKKIYKDFRNKIMHEGELVGNNEENYLCIYQLKNYVVFSLMGVVNRIENIIKHGQDGSAIRKYFELEKLR